jgi:hypothetical protein
MFLNSILPNTFVDLVNREKNLVELLILLCNGVLPLLALPDQNIEVNQL